MISCVTTIAGAAHQDGGQEERTNTITRFTPRITQPLVEAPEGLTS